MRTPELTAYSISLLLGFAAGGFAWRFRASGLRALLFCFVPMGGVYLATLFC